MEQKMAKPAPTATFVALCFVTAVIAQHWAQKTKSSIAPVDEFGEAA